MFTLRVLLNDRQADNLELPHGSVAFIAWFDVDALDGFGAARLTEDSREAIWWPTRHDAMAAWYSQSTVKPLRDDGKPNRPLTAYTVELIAGDYEIQNRFGPDDANQHRAALHQSD